MGVIFLLVALRYHRDVVETKALERSKRGLASLGENERA